MRAPILLAVTVLLAGCGGQTDKAGGTPAHRTTTLTLADPVGDPLQLDAFVAAVDRLSHGMLRVVPRTGWRAGDLTYERDTIADVEHGRSDLAVTGTRAWDIGALNALSAPLLIDSYRLEDLAVDSPLVTQALHDLPRPLAAVGVLPGPLRRPLGVTRALRGPADFHGARIGIVDSPVAARTLRALGATPVLIPQSSPLRGLDGLEAHISGIEARGDDREATVLTRDVVLWARPALIFANRARVTSAQLRVLKAALVASIGPTTQQRLSAETGDTAVLCAHNRLRFPAGDRRALRRAVAPVYTWLERDLRARRLIAQIETERRTPPSAVPACPRAAAPTERRGAVAATDGVYAGGHFRIVLDRGRLRLSQSSDHSDWGADGPTRTTGDVVTWTVRDAFDVGPHGAPAGVPFKPGDRVRLRRRAGGLQPLDPRLPALARTGDAPGQQPANDSAALRGTWAMTPTAADTLAHHGDPGGISDNTGPLTLTIAPTHCRWTQHAPDGDHWGEGTCEIAGDTLEFDATRTDQSVTPAPQFWHWSLFHDRLTLTAAPGFSPEAWTYHPWRRCRRC